MVPLPGGGAGSRPLSLPPTSALQPVPISSNSVRAERVSLGIGRYEEELPTQRGAGWSRESGGASRLTAESRIRVNKPS